VHDCTIVPELGISGGRRQSVGRIVVGACASSCSRDKLVNFRNETHKIEFIHFFCKKLLRVSFLSACSAASSASNAPRGDGIRARLPTLPHTSVILAQLRHFESRQSGSDSPNTNPVFLGLLIKTFNGVVVHCGDCACAGWSRNFDQQPSTWSAAAALTRTVTHRPATLPLSCPTTNQLHDECTCLSAMQFTIGTFAGW
jgi:hypothetical protein